MKNFMMFVMVAFCLALAGSVDAGIVVRGVTRTTKADTTAFNWSDFAHDFVGTRPDHWVEVGVGYGGYELSAPVSDVSYNLAWFKEQYGQYDQINTQTNGGVLVSLVLNLSSKFFAEMDYDNSSTNQSWNWTQPGSSGSLGEITTSVPFSVSLNYAPFNWYGIRPYIGGGWSYATVSGSYHNYLGNLSTTVDQSSCFFGRAGVKFPLVWGLIGSVEWQGGKGVSVTTPFTPASGGALHTTGIDASSVCGSIAYPLF